MENGIKAMKIVNKILPIVVLFVLTALTGCASSPEQKGGWYALRWIERPSSHGPSTMAAAEDQTRFELISSYDHEKDSASFGQATAKLREGDVIAYRMGGLEATKEVLKGD
ncbi:MAG: hypothetical protein P8171_25465, partial [Candidatus Thiodiazotropha sp.]